MVRYAGQIVRAADHEVLWARKKTDESVVSSTTLQNDDELFLRLDPSSIYEFEALLFYVGNAAGDIKIAWATPYGHYTYWAGLGGSESDGGYGVAGATRHSASLDEHIAAYPFTASTSPLAIHARGIVRTGDVPVNFQLQWAQNVSNATPTTVKAFSFLKAERRD